MAMAPLMALFMIIAAQLGATFSRAVREVAEADARAARVVREWDAENEGKGLMRPCIEMIEEVRVAALPICIP